jgi:cytochrome c-type biogenesis protein CcmF
MIFADLAVTTEGGALRAHLSPGKFMYKKQPDSPETRVAISHGLRDDVYVIVGTINPSTKVAAFQIHVNPLVSWIWIGCLVLVAGSFVCMWPQFELGESRIWAGARGLAATAISVTLGILLAATPAARAQPNPAGMPMTGTGTVHIESDEERSIFGALRCMCGDCAREPLSTCTCSSAAEARQRIHEKIVAGEKRDQIIAEYAAEYGADGLTVPPNRGVFRAIWVVPVTVISLGIVGVASVVKRWRAGAIAAAPEAVKPPAQATDAYDARIDDELNNLDG